MEKTVRTLKWMVILLALLNIALLIFMFMHRGGRKHGGPPPPMERSGPGGRIIHELDLDEKQTAEFEKLKEEHHSLVMKYQEEGRRYRDSLFEKLDVVTSADQISVLADSIAAKQKAIEIITFDHFSKVRKLCNEEQKKKFDAIIGDVLKNLLGPPRPPRPPQGPPPPDGPPPPPGP